MASHGYSSGSQQTANNTYNPPTPPRNAQATATNNSYPGYTGHHAYYSNSHPAPSTPPHGFQPAPTSPKTPTEPVAFFMFFNCKTTGTNIHKDHIVELSLQCWPYIENAPTFHSKVDIGQERPNKVRGKNKKGQKKGISHPDDSVGHPFPVVWKHLMQWLDRILNHATNVIGTQIYPVLVAHHGDTYDFHFLFTALEEHGIALDAPSKLDICFCDPVPLLKQYKEYAHPWLVESRSMSLGSLLNDWLPGQFDIGDLYICPGKTLLAAKLYTQTPMYWLLKEFPVYTTKEWIEYYNEVKLYREDKKSLEDNFPPNVPEVQRKFAVRSLLQWGYNWEALVDLYKSCTSPEHFRQEMKDCDLKSGPASQLTWKFVDEKIPQDGTRQYQVRIKENMPPQRYTHLTDRRGRWWILRVKNILPPCIYSINDLFVNLPTTNQWRAPENLLLIRFPEAWYPTGLEGQAEDEIIEELHLGDTVYNSDEDGDSLDSWDEEEDEEAALRQSLQPIEDLVKEQPAPPPITTLQFGDQSSAYNPFAEQQKQKDLQEELKKEENARRIRDMWESVKGDEKQPSSFGQAIKFCRPSGGEEDRPRKQKDTDKDGNVDKTRRGKKNKQQGEKGPRSGKGRPDRTLGRSQSWTPEVDNNKKSDEGKQQKPRTVSCSAESWDDETSSTPVEPMSKKDKTTSQTKDDVSAVTRRMINFHLASNNKKSRNPKNQNKNGRRNNRSDRYQEKQQTNRYTKGNDSREGNMERKPWGNPQNTQSSAAKWNDTSRGWQTGWGSQSKTSSAVHNAAGSTLITQNQSQAWGPVSDCPVQNKIGDGQLQEEEWGAGETANPSCKSSDSNQKTVPTHENPCNSQRKDQQEVKNSAWSSNSDIKGKERKESESGAVRSLGRSSNRESNGGVRRPKEVSKAQALANKVSGQSKASVDQTRSLQHPTQGKTSATASVVQPASQPQQQPQATQLTQPKPTRQPNSSATVLEHGSAPLGVQSKTKYGTPPRNKMQSQNTRHAAGSRNNREQNFAQKNHGGNDQRFDQCNRSSNRNWREQETNSAQSTVISQPVVANSFEETEDWDEEIGDDGYYGL